MYHLSNSDSPVILKLLEDICGTKLPKRGLLAGQAVSSAILYLKGIRKSIVVNDLDVFHVVPEIIERPGMVKYNHYSKAGGLSLSMHETEMYIDKQSKVNLEAIQNSTSWSEDEGEDDYNGILLAARKKYIRKQNILKVNPYANFTNFDRQGYAIYDVFRNGMLNSVIVKARDLSYYSIINEFDINATMVGICLETGQLYYTKEFLEFLHVKQLRVTNSARPHHTLIRLLKKSEELGMSFNEELSLDILNTVILLEDKKVYDEVISREVEVHSLSVGANHCTDSRFKLPLMGKVYQNKINEITNFPSEYTLANIQVDKRIRTEKKKVIDTEEKYDLFRFKTSLDMPAYIRSNQHRDLLEKRANAVVVGYPTLLKFCAAPILTSFYEANKKAKIFTGDGIKLSESHPQSELIASSLISNKELPDKADLSNGLTERQYEKLKDDYQVWRLLQKTPIEHHSLVWRYNQILKQRKYTALRYSTFENRSKMLDAHAALDVTTLQPNQVTKGIEAHIDHVIEIARRCRLRHSFDIPVVDVSGYEVIELNSNYALEENVVLSGARRSPIWYYRKDIANGKILYLQLRHKGKYAGNAVITIHDNKGWGADADSPITRKLNVRARSTYLKNGGYSTQKAANIINKYMEKLSDMGIINSLINEYHKN